MLPEVREFARAAGPPAGARDLGGTVTVRIGPQTHTLLGRTCGDIVVFTFADPAGPRCGRHPFRRQPEEGEIVIDFNRTVLPGCCFSPICPEPEIPAQIASTSQSLPASARCVGAARPPADPGCADRRPGTGARRSGHEQGLARELEPP